MRYRNRIEMNFIATLTDFELQDEPKTAFNEFQITSDATALDPELVDELLKLLGTEFHDTIIRGFKMTFDGEYSQFPFILKTDPETLIVKLLTNRASLQVLSLWLIKDNSVSISKGVFANSKRIAVETPLVVNSLSNGERQVTTFSAIEIDEAEDLFAKMLLLQTPVESEFVEMSAGTVHSPLHFVPYDKNVTRISRAFNFLIDARSFSFLPKKIAAYIAMLECLFTSGESEITHSVSERVAFYLNGTSGEKETHYKLIKTAYSIRSKFVHGQVLKSNISSFSSLELISKDLDTVIRKIIIMIINGDSEQFLKNDEELNTWFRSLIFGS